MDFKQNQKPGSQCFPLKYANLFSNLALIKFSGLSWIIIIYWKVKSHRMHPSAPFHLSPMELILVSSENRVIKRHITST